MATRKRKPSARRTQSAGAKPDQELMQKLRRYIRTNGAEFLKDRNITSIGIGYKIKDGKRTDQISLQFTVASKLEGVALEEVDTEVIPKTARPPTFWRVSTSRAKPATIPTSTRWPATPIRSLKSLKSRWSR